MLIDSAACRKLSVAFYARVGGDPLLRPLFPGKNFHCAIEEFSAFLVQFFDGPNEDTQRRWWLSLRESHARFKIGEPERAAWMGHMVAALDETGHPELRSLFEHSSVYVIGRESGREPLNAELTERWNRQLLLDRAVAAVRSADSDLAAELAGQLRDQPVFAALLDCMIRSGNRALCEYASREIQARPTLIADRFNNRRTLLHGAAASGNVTIAKLLLSLGAKPNSLDGGGHTPLYAVANECATGGDVVRMLVNAGADVNACGGVKRCTPLHMAARRGNVEIARTLLACGANPGAQDSLGVTPLQRALNCRKAAVAEFLRRESFRPAAAF